MTSRDPAVGDLVRLKAVPDWLIRDLPESEKHDILSCIGRTFVIEDIDKYGYFWVGFGKTAEEDETARYSGHSFCVPRDCLAPC